MKISDIRRQFRRLREERLMEPEKRDKILAYLEMAFMFLKAEHDARRDRFATASMQAVIASERPFQSYLGPHAVAASAYTFADAMIEESARPPLAITRTLNALAEYDKGRTPIQAERALDAIAAAVGYTGGK